MNELRRLAVHLLLLVAAAGFAYVKSRPDDLQDRPLQPGEVDLWGGKPEDVTRVELTDDRQTVVIERKQDDTGIYYAGSVKPGPDKPEPPPEPDAGSKPKPPPRKVEPATFISVKVAESLVEKLAPLRAKRQVGVVEKDRESAFGLDEPLGKLSIDVGGVKHSFVLGATTPGATNRYVRYEKDGMVYVIDASVVRDMQGGAGRLAERQQHAWKMAEVTRAVVSGGENKRAFIRSGPEGRRFWADADKPDVNDETAGNWLTKVDRLRPITYVDALPDGAAKVVRIDFEGEKGKLGFLELHRVDGDKPTYYVRTEHVRLPAEVAKPTAEQVRDDLASLFGLAPPPSEDGSSEEGEPKPGSSSSTPEGPTAPKAPAPKAPAPKAPAPKAPKAPAPKAP